MHVDEPAILSDLVDLLRRGIWLALVAAILGAVAAHYLSRELPPTYQAQATLLAPSQDANQRDFGTTLVTAPALDVATYRSAIASRPILVDAIRALTVLSDIQPTNDDVEILRNALTVTAEEARVSSVVRISVRANDARRAASLANAVAGAAVRWDEARATRALETIMASLSAQIDSLELEIAAAAPGGALEGLQRTRGDLQLQLSSARALRTAAVGRLELLEEAETPRGSIAPRPRRNAVLAGIFMIFLVYGLLLLRAALNTRVTTVENLARLTGLPVLAEFPRVTTGRRGIAPETASHLRTAVGFATAEVHPKVILITSAFPGQGKSTVAIALAESFARLHYRTVLVDADLRRPVIGTEYSLNPIRVASVREALNAPDRQPEPAQLAFGRTIELDVIPGFNPVPDAAEILSKQMPGLLQRLKKDYDVIILDSAPLLPVADTLTIAPHCTGVVLAVSVPEAQRAAVLNAITLLRRVGIPLLGTVATNLKRSRRERKGYGYGYGYETDEELAKPHVRTVHSAGAARRRPPPGLPADEGS